MKAAAVATTTAKAIGMPTRAEGIRPFKKKKKTRNVFSRLLKITKRTTRAASYNNNCIYIFFRLCNGVRAVGVESLALVGAHCAQVEVGTIFY